MVHCAAFCRIGEELNGSTSCLGKLEKFFGVDSSVECTLCKRGKNMQEYSTWWPWWSCVFRPIAFHLGDLVQSFCDIPTVESQVLTSRIAKKRSCVDHAPVMNWHLLWDVAPDIARLLVWAARGLVGWLATPNSCVLPKATVLIHLIHLRFDSDYEV